MLPRFCQFPSSKEKKRSFSCRAEYEITFDINFYEYKVTTNQQPQDSAAAAAELNTAAPVDDSFVSWFSRIKVANFLSLSSVYTVTQRVNRPDFVQKLVTKWFCSQSPL